MTIQLLVSDMAGTTVSDDGIVIASFTDAIGSQGIAPDDDRYGPALQVVLDTMGMSKIVVFRQILGNEERAQAATAAFEASIADRIRAGEVHALPGAESALREIAESGVRIALTTGFSDPTRELLVEHLGWAELADLSLSPSTTLRGRPFPDLALAALIELEIDDVRSMAIVGDTANDLLAGHRSGASIVAGVLTGAHDRAALESAPHTHILDSVVDLPAVLAGA